MRSATIRSEAAMVPLPSVSRPANASRSIWRWSGVRRRAVPSLLPAVPVAANTDDDTSMEALAS